MNILKCIIGLCIFLTFSSCEKGIADVIPPTAPDLIIERCIIVFSERAGQEKALHWANYVIPTANEFVTTESFGKIMYCHDFVMNKGIRLTASKPTPIHEMGYFALSISSMTEVVAYMVEWVASTDTGVVQWGE